MKKIKVQTPTYDENSGIASMRISEQNGAISNVSIDFKTLLPFANLADQKVVDFFFITSAVYGIDRFINRKLNSVDGWSREFDVSFPVSDLTKWNGVEKELEELFSFLTGDYWKISFYESNFTYPKVDIPTEYRKSFKQVNLFSGGLDSLIGAIDFLSKSNKENILFVSHYDPQMKGPKSDQEHLLYILKNQYNGLFEHIPSVKVTLSSTSERRETTFRSRSILFIGIAVLVSQGKNITEIIVPENGSVSLNYPLSPSRRTSCSTRTTHAYVLDKTNVIFSKLGIDSIVSNPYEFMTKGNMVDNCNDLEFLTSIINSSNSCGKRGHRRSWVDRSATHCGVCMPCIYRRASMYNQYDDTKYGSDIDSLIPFKTKKSQDVGICLDFLKKPLTKDEIKTELIVNGVKNLKKLDSYVNVVWNTREELSKWFKKNGNTTTKIKGGL